MHEQAYQNNLLKIKHAVHKLEEVRHRISKYSAELKMSRAETLLLRPDAPVRDIAIAVGYKDARLFARNFKSAYGKNPTEYRNEHAVE